MANDFRKALFRRAVVVRFGGKVTRIGVNQSTPYHTRVKYTLAPEYSEHFSADFIDYLGRRWRNRQKGEPVSGDQYVGKSVMLEIREATGDFILVLDAGLYGVFASKL